MTNKCAKDFSDSNLIKQLLTKYHFSRNYPKFNIFTKIVFFQNYNGKFLGQPPLLYKFHGRGMYGILFLNFASCEPFNRFVCVNDHSNIKHATLYITA